MILSKRIFHLVLHINDSMINRRKTSLLTSFPRVVEQTERSVDSFPMWQMEESVRDAFTVSTLQNMLRRKY